MRFVRSAVAGSLLMPGILHELLAADAADPLAPEKPHFPAKAKSVIFLFMSGGVSHVDSFDPKPKLIADHGKQVTLDHPETRNRPGYEKLFLKRPDWKFAPRGKSGIEVSDLFPHVARADRRRRLDPLDAHRATRTTTTPRSACTPARSRSPGRASARGSATASARRTATCRRSWSSPRRCPTPARRSGRRTSCPVRTRGRASCPARSRCANLQRRACPPTRQQLELDALAGVQRGAPDDAAPTTPHLAARIRSFETAFGMQSEMPEALDLSKETDDDARPLRPEARADRRLRLAVPRRPPAGRARRALRRADRHRLERTTGTRTATWPTTAGWRSRSTARSPGCSRDLKRRGLLDDTLVVWTTEFGRTPFNNTADNPGREHHNWAFTLVAGRRRA